MAREQRRSRLGYRYGDFDEGLFEFSFIDRKLERGLEGECTAPYQPRIIFFLVVLRRPSILSRFVFESRLTGEQTCWRQLGALIRTYKKIYACDPTPPRTPGETLGTVELNTSELLDWNTRVLKVEAYAKRIWDYLNDKLNPKDPEGGRKLFEEPEPTSAMFALQLNEPIYALNIVAMADDASRHSLHPAAPDFRFSVPRFPAHEHMPSKPLPIPARRERVVSAQLHRQTVDLRPRLRVSKVPRPITQLHPLENRPRWNIKMYTVDHKEFVPTRTYVPQDIIVSLTIPQELQQVYSYTLLSLELRIPCGDINSPGIPREDGKGNFYPLLSTDGDLPVTGTMLSNLRFNVISSWVQGGRDADGRFHYSQLVIEVIPRAENGVSMFNMVEASFMLPAVRIIEWGDDRVARPMLYPMYEENQKTYKQWEDGPKEGIPMVPVGKSEPQV
ncbi:uncharacterized protein TRIVIDRAFT_222291 [Trichoderma virens Gv29-8]|uniref:Uncharacterized protein n=1 Tax=Hypocrea virens (strain Gv29-8 / FGSC 10586) TaxID=413071 RepID=G9MST5_HYPVG|nr:uncharacterized protein TRIVIDRAFT_222291 [Trichoderma virens Gv29-8]EHK23034.1 hypothetical protein TRIVIDRAFT_222291 [Trichoderma virens Gv29-8]